MKTSGAAVHPPLRVFAAKVALARPWNSHHLGQVVVVHGRRANDVRALRHHHRQVRAHDLDVAEGVQELAAELERFLLGGGGAIDPGIAEQLHLAAVAVGERAPGGWPASPCRRRRSPGSARRRSRGCRRRGSGAGCRPRSGCAACRRRRSAGPRNGSSRSRARDAAARRREAARRSGHCAPATRCRQRAPPSSPAAGRPRRDRTGAGARARSAPPARDRQRTDRPDRRPRGRRPRPRRQRVPSSERKGPCSRLA